MLLYFRFTLKAEASGSFLVKGRSCMAAPLSCTNHAVPLRELGVAVITPLLMNQSFTGCDKTNRAD